MVQYRISDFVAMTCCTCDDLCFRDGDGIPDERDNCQFIPNSQQSDIDADNIGMTYNIQTITKSDIAKKVVLLSSTFL